MMMRLKRIEAGAARRRLLRVMLCAETEITLRAEVVRKFPLEN